MQTEAPRVQWDASVEDTTAARPEFPTVTGASVPVSVPLALSSHACAVESADAILPRLLLKTHRCPTNCAAGKSSVAGSDAVGDCTNCAAGKFSSAGGTCTDCPSGQTSNAGDATCTSAGVTCAANTYEDDTNAGNGCKACPTGTTAAATPTAGQESRCEGIAAGYYGTQGVATGGSKAHATVTACTATFSGATAAGITSAASTSSNAETACKTAPGFIITSCA